MITVKRNTLNLHFVLQLAYYTAKMTIKYQIRYDYDFVRIILKVSISLRMTETIETFSFYRCNVILFFNRRNIKRKRQVINKRLSFGC